MTSGDLMNEAETSVSTPESAACRFCGHQHAGVALAGICIGCPCPWVSMCSCTPSGCDEEGDPGCGYCRSLDSEWPCPAEEAADDALAGVITAPNSTGAGEGGS